MTARDTLPVVPLEDFKRTKIIATIGPSTHSYEAVLQLIKSGANGIRLNFSHGKPDERTEQIKWIRQASQAIGKPVAIIQDLQGPKIRLGDFEGEIIVAKGQKLSFAYQADYAISGHIPTQYDLSQKVKHGERIYISDGKVRTSVISVREGVVHVTAQNSGHLTKRKGMNLPDTDFGGDIITAKDQADLKYGATQQIDYVALSFVQQASDIVKLRQLLKRLKSTARVIAKIETKAAVNNMEAIVRESDAIMIARGDLGVETPPESVPIVQRQIIGLGLRYATPTIVATHMLASMSETSEPTRAEISDIATAVLVGADCVMLSDETASGKYPHEAVRIMKRVVRYTEGHPPFKVSWPAVTERTLQEVISGGVINLAEGVNAKAIVAETRSGAMVRLISSLRPAVPIIAVTSEEQVARQLAIVYAVKSYVRSVDAQAAAKLTIWLQQRDVFQTGDVIVTASGRYPGIVGSTDTIKVRVLE